MLVRNENSGISGVRLHHNPSDGGRENTQTYKWVLALFHKALSSHSCDWDCSPCLVGGKVARNQYKNNKRKYIFQMSISGGAWAKEERERKERRLLYRKWDERSQKRGEGCLLLITFFSEPRENMERGFLSFLSYLSFSIPTCHTLLDERSN